MKRHLFRIIKLLCLILAIGLTVGVLQEYVFCHADHNRQRIKGFFEEERDSLPNLFFLT